MERHRDLLVAGLAMATGAMDAIGFLGLGGVFTSVMTGNMVLLGLGVGDRRGGLVLRAGLALVGYIVGVVAGSQLARRIGGSPGVWPGRVTVVLLFELVVMLGFATGWELAGARPGGAPQALLIVAASLAMGMQSADIRELGVQGLSTTYLTGTLTATVSDLARGRRSAGTGRDVGILLALVLGAAVGGVLVTEVPRAAPAFPLAVLTAVIVVAAATFGKREI
ncbi:MAG: hypothetical protein JWN29_2252 [Acidimicrobiales bacterium]|jgi:uncharacterized membrane protein YoaK (UPF0700 family)|nr:hypothetical protein [Acidimicrobiales bacterium]